MTEIASKDRMIAAAVTLFSRAGFNGITTRDIAHSANVSEGNIFRYFPSKRDLFIAAIDSELGKLSVRAEVLAEGADVEDSRVALRTLFELITDTVVTQPDWCGCCTSALLSLVPTWSLCTGGIWMRLLLPRRPISKSGRRITGSANLNARVTVLSFVATVILLQNYPLFTGSVLPFPSVESAAASYAELWYRVLSDTDPATSVAQSLETVQDNNADLLGTIAHRFSCGKRNHASF